MTPYLVYKSENISLTDDQIISMLRKITDSKYVTVKIKWFHDEQSVEILNQSNNLLIETRQYESSSTGNVGYEIKSLYLGN